jgi:hypothetical protein
MGIIVPIIFLVTGFLYSWISGDPDKTLGNPTMLAWTSMISGILLTLIGLGALNITTQDAQGNTKRAKHDFFYIPVIVWGLLLGGLSIYFFITKGGNATPDATTEAEGASSTTPPPPQWRYVNFYNPTADEITYVLADDTKDGLVSSEAVAPGAVTQLVVDEGSYLVTAYNSEKEALFSYPDKAFADDETKYKVCKDDKGSFYQRIVNPRTDDTKDYDEAWIVLDGKTQLLLVDVTSSIADEITAADVKKIDWATNIQEEYDPRDMIEPLYKLTGRKTVVNPGESFPVSITSTEKVYLLVPYSGKGDKTAVVNKAVMASWIQTH